MALPLQQVIRRGCHRRQLHRRTTASATQHSLRSGAALFWEDDVAAIAAAVFQPAGSEAPPIVVIGAGPAGLRVVQELLRQGVERPIVLCGAETYQP
jgi:NADPH-dependent 2,4-dienoyl-CoA reductase/sulfur reductase-like enzyme